MHCRPRSVPSRPGVGFARSGGARGGAAYLVLGGFAAARTRLPLLSVAGAARFAAQRFYVCLCWRFRYEDSDLTVLALRLGSAACKRWLLCVAPSTTPDQIRRVYSPHISAHSSWAAGEGSTRRRAEPLGLPLQLAHLSPHAVYATSPDIARPQECARQSPHYYAAAPPSSATALPSDAR